MKKPLKVAFSAAFCCAAAATAGFEKNMDALMDNPILYLEIAVPKPFLVESRYGRFGGDIRAGDLTGDGRMDLLVYRTAHGVKPCFIGAFDMDGAILWSSGQGGDQPARPGPVAVYDIDGDGASEVICFFREPGGGASPDSLDDVVVRVLDGKTGEVKRSAHPPEFDRIRGEGANWVHQRILIANLRGNDTPRDFVVKLGKTILAFDDRLSVLWSYESPWEEYGHCPAYIPCVGDIDGDGRDEVNGGYSMLDHDGSVVWEKRLAPHMDSVAISEWDNGRTRAFCSGGGHVLDFEGNVILGLGEQIVPHGQELRVARFDPAKPGPQMMIRYNGHAPDIMLVGADGEAIGRFRVNESPNDTGMEAVYWRGPAAPALLYNGGMLWNGDGTLFAGLPGLPAPRGDKKQGWHHCIPVELLDGPGEEMLIYNPWDCRVFIYAAARKGKGARWKFKAGPRQYNARLMD